MKTIARYVTIESSTKPGESHTLVVFSDGSSRCSCKGHFYYGKCRHITDIAKIQKWEEVVAQTPV